MADNGFFGHPKALGYLAFTDVWERFSYYGMQALLPLYMVQYLLLPENVGQVWGFAAFRSGIESVTGPLSTIALTVQIFGLYVFGVYIAVLAGGWIGDRVTGRKVAVLAGGALMALGHLVMAWEALFLPALLMLIVGAGMFKGNLIAQVGGLYATDDQRRTRAFGIYTISSTIGSLMAPIICGTLGEMFGWHIGFGAAAVGMTVGFVIYVSALRHLPQESPRARATKRSAPAGTTETIIALLIVFFAYFVIIASVVQGYSTLMVWAIDNVDRDVFGFEMPVTWLLIFDAISLICAMLIAMRLWAKQSALQRESTDYLKIIFGGAFFVAGFIMLSVATSFAGEGKVPVSIVVLFFVLVGFGVAFVDAPLKALTTRCAPPAISTTMIGVMMAAFGFANLAAGWLGRYYEPLGAANFWLLNAAIAASGAILLLLVRRLVETRLEKAAHQETQQYQSERETGNDIVQPAVPT